jgi:DNA repair ATPase RecN
MEDTLLKIVTGGGVSTYAFWAIFFLHALKTVLVFIEKRDIRIHSQRKETETMHWEAVKTILDRQDKEIMAVKKDLTEVHGRLTDCEDDRRDLRRKLEALEK